MTYADLPELAMEKVLDLSASSVLEINTLRRCTPPVQYFKFVLHGGTLWTVRSATDSRKFINGRSLLEAAEACSHSIYCNANEMSCSSHEKKSCVA